MPTHAWPDTDSARTSCMPFVAVRSRDVPTIRICAKCCQGEQNAKVQFLSADIAYRPGPVAPVGLPASLSPGSAVPGPVTGVPGNAGIASTGPWAGTAEGSVTTGGGVTAPM